MVLLEQQADARLARVRQEAAQARVFPSVGFLRVDCTKSRKLCETQMVHAFPTIRTYRGTIHSYEPYEFGREENVLWLHLVKMAAETVVQVTRRPSRHHRRHRHRRHLHHRLTSPSLPPPAQHVKDIPSDDRKAYTVQIAHISADLKEVMTRREQGLDEDWSEDALSADEEVLRRTASCLRLRWTSRSRRIVAAKGVHPEQVRKATLDGNVGEGDAEGVAKREVGGAVVEAAGRRERGAAGGVARGEQARGLPPLRLRRRLARAGHAAHLAALTRHSFDFQAINTSHHIDHLSFGLELPTKERARPPNVVGKLAALDDAVFLTHAAHETKEHHINVMPTSYATHRHPIPIETFQFTSTSHSRTKETLPSLIISYDVSPIMVRIKEAAPPLSDFIVSLCAIVGGAFAIFGILDGFIYTSQNAVKSRIGKLS